ncbi:patatin-like phospholipase family protein [Agromyces sp. ZXT2-6]|uniref:patatin-like phospholipase family protein n=1 Tax=Agromyces sp. ZXT2-6 TaxID=3461153 RepID=UPI004054DF0D
MSPRIGLALSGGGFRATAFGLGSLRALHDRDLLRQVTVVSGISGGSLLTAMWAYGPERFDEFDDTVTEVLRAGLQWELARRAFAPRAAGRAIASAVHAIGGRQGRSYSRTDALVEALAARDFGAKLVTDVTHAGTDAVISSTDMRTGNAVRFGSAVSACSPYGTILSEVTVAEAVAASAAFPVLLPALRRGYEFVGRDGTHRSEQLVMTDGGVYDNLGLAPLLPGRSRQFSSHVFDLDYIVAVDAGRGRVERPAARFMVGRLAQSFDITHTKSQDAGRSRVHSARENAQLEGFVHVYLGMRDERLPISVADLVPRTRVQNYPTNFAPMTTAHLEAIAIRGEQLTRTLLNAYTPDLGA